MPVGSVSTGGVLANPTTIVHEVPSDIEWPSVAGSRRYVARMRTEGTKIPASLCWAFVVALTIVSSCGSDGSAVCVSNDVAEVCADNSNGSIVFSGSGLEPESDVRIDSTTVGSDVYRVGADGTFEPGGRGVLSAFDGALLTFTISGVDTNGDPIQGDIVITT